MLARVTYTDGLMSRLKPRLHQTHVAGYKSPGRATCRRIQVLSSVLLAGTLLEVAVATIL